MKKLILAVLTFAASTAFATTFTPIQLLNPAGSTAGQAIVSTGPTTPGAWGSVNAATLNGATFASPPSTGYGSTTPEPVAATTLSATGTTTLSNSATVSYANPIIVISDTSGSGRAYVAWRNNGTNLWDFDSNSSTGTFVLDRYVSGAFTDSPISVSNSTGLVSLSDGISTSTINASSLITPTSTIGIKGTATNDNAQAGSDGEYASNSTTGTSISSGSTVNATTVPLTAGDWDVQCQIVFSPSSGISYTAVQGAVSNTSITFAITGANAGFGFPANTSTTGWTIVTPVTRMSLAASGTGYCVANTTFSAGTMTVNGFIRARRIR
jgi:hypothetical protein